MRAGLFAIVVLVLLGSCKSRKAKGLDATAKAGTDAIAVAIEDSVDDEDRARELLGIQAEMAKVTEGFLRDSADARIRMFRRNANYDATAWDFEKIHREVAAMRRARAERLIELAMMARRSASEAEWVEIAKRWNSAVQGGQ